MMFAAQSSLLTPSTYSTQAQKKAGQFASQMTGSSPLVQYQAQQNPATFAKDGRGLSTLLGIIIGVLGSIVAVQNAGLLSKVLEETGTNTEMPVDTQKHLASAAVPDVGGLASVFSRDDGDEVAGKSTEPVPRGGSNGSKARRTNVARDNTTTTAAASRVISSKSPFSDSQIRQINEVTADICKDRSNLSTYQAVALSILAAAHRHEGSFLVPETKKAVTAYMIQTILKNYTAYKGAVGETDIWKFYKCPSSVDELKRWNPNKVVKGNLSCEPGDVILYCSAK